MSANLKFLSTFAASKAWFHSTLDWSSAGSDALGAWFLGPKAENEELLIELVESALRAHAATRRQYYPTDPPWLTPARQNSAAYQDAVNTLRGELDSMLTALDASVPFYSYRYQGHMLWDVTLPSVAGYIAALLYNQNNVAAEASPVTTWYEMLVGDDLCRMLGFYAPERTSANEGEYAEQSAQIVGWGHITCGGTVANIESLWAARNAKLLPVGVHKAVCSLEVLAPARSLKVRLADGTQRALCELSSWELLNLPADVCVELPGRVKAACDAPADMVEQLLTDFSVQQLGLAHFLADLPASQRDLVLLTPSTAHYSWPKGASVVGLGRGAAVPIQVDLDARMNVDALRSKLEMCLREEKPIIMVVAVLGTTEQSAIDPLEDILELREEYRAKGLDFWLHVDGAWGGYFASMLRAPKRPAQVTPALQSATETDSQTILYGPDIVMSSYVNAQYAQLGRVDSITVDPHKAGYAPYPAGGLCYRNSAMRHLVAFTSPVVYHGTVDPTVGVYGIEGSKPGAAAAGVYLSHRVIRTDQSGYGRILGRCLWNSKRLYCQLITMARDDDPFEVVAIQRLPSERRNASAEVVRREHQRVAQLVPLSNEQLVARLNNDPEELAWFRELGSDQVILSYAFNRKGNKDLAQMNKLNQAIFGKLSLSQRKPDLPEIPLYVTSSKLDVKTCGQPLFSDFKRRLGIEDASQTPIDFLISTTMDPWLSDTAEGSFIPQIVAALRQVVLEMIHSPP